MVCSESRVLAEYMGKTTGELGGGDQKHETSCNLRDHQRIAAQESLAVMGGLYRFERWDKIGLRRLERGHKPEQERACHGYGRGEPKNPLIQLKRELDGHLARYLND